MDEDELYDSFMRQMQVLGQALDIFQEKNQKYQDMWRQSPQSQLDGLIQHKWDRIQKLGIEATEEDGLDMINYIAFKVRKNRGV